MALFGDTALAMDAGSCFTRVSVQPGTVALREATCVLTLREDENAVMDVGSDALHKFGRAGDDVTIRYPLQDGAVTDKNMAALYLLAMAEKALRHKKPLDKVQLFLSAPMGLTKVEREALEQTAQLMGARKPAFVLTPLAAAVGAGLETIEERASMVVTLGGALTEIAIISMNGIAASRSIRSGALSMDDAIVRYIRREKGLIIGERTAERLKIDIGQAVVREELTEEEKKGVLVKGRDTATRDAKTVTVTCNDIALAVKENVAVLVDAMRDALARTPVALATDVAERGILLSGGGAQLRGLKELLEKETGVPVHVGSHPEEDAAIGLMALSTDARYLRSAVENGSVEM